MALKITDESKLYFNTDDDFYTFCVVPELVICERFSEALGQNVRYTDFNFSHGYLDAIANNKTFIIRQPDSQICKRGCVSYRTITKPVCNVKQQFIYPKNKLNK